jgi:hypothetical protein
MPDTQTAVSIRGNAPLLDEVVNFNIGGEPAQIKKRFYLAGEMAGVLRIDKSKIPNFDGDAVVERIVEGPPGFLGLWSACLAIMAFAPGMYSQRSHVKKPISKTGIADYPSRKEVQTMHINGLFMTTVYMDTKDIYQLFLKFDVPVVRKEAARLVYNEMDVATAVDIKKDYVCAGDVADVFGIDTSVIADFDEGALIEKVVQGPPDVQGKWNLCSVMMAFAPGKYGLKKSATLAVKQTSIADYPSRKEVQTTHYNVS